MFGYYEYQFDKNTNISTLELFKADGTSLGELKNAYDRVTKLTLGGVSQLSFKLPNTSSVFNILSDEGGIMYDVPDTPSDDIGRTSITIAGYEIKATYSNGMEIMYLLPNKVLETDIAKTDIGFTCYSKEYELSHKLLLDYRGVLIDGEYVLDGLSLEEVVRDILGGTYWDVDFLDEGYNNTDVNCIRRSIEAFNGVSKLSAIDSICTIFGAIPEYDTINMTVSFYRADNEGKYKYNGLNIEGSNYLNNARKSEDLTQIVTRLYGIGNNNLTINGVNPTGVSYIEDLSYFLYPAELNASGTGLTKSSKFMSDALAYNELKYEEKIVNATGNFQTLYERQDYYNQIKITKENELANLQRELNIINDYIDVMYVGQNTAVSTNSAYVAKRTEKENKEAQIIAKQNEINAVNTSLTTISNELKALYETLKVENNFTPALLKEREYYIYEGTYTNTGISIEQDLYDEMVEYLLSKHEPSIVVDMELNSLFSMKNRTAQKDKQKITLGEQIDVYCSFKTTKKLRTLYPMLSLFPRNNLLSIGSKYDQKKINEYESIDIKAQILEIEINEEDNSMTLTIANRQDYKKDASDYLEKILQRSITTSTTVENNVIDWNKGKIALDDINDLYQNGIDAAKLQIEGAANNSVTYNERGLTIKDTTEPLRFLRATNGVLALTKDGGRTYSTAITPEGVIAERLIGRALVGNNLSIIGGSGEELKMINIPAGTYTDRTLTNANYGDDFGLVLQSAKNRVFMTKERGFKIVDNNNQNLFIADNSGNMYLTGTIVSNNVTITGGSLTIGTKFSVTNDGTLSATGVNVTGTINATTLNSSNGNIGGYSIGEHTLKGGNVGMCSASGYDWAFWAGSNDSGSAPFKVGHDGSLYATNAFITGEVTATSGTFRNCTVTGSCNIQCSVPGNLVTSGVNAGNITTGTLSADRISAGSITGDKISAGTITADKLNVSSLSAITADIGNITSGQLHINNNFNVDTAGDVYLGGSNVGNSLFSVWKNNNIIWIGSSSSSPTLAIWNNGTLEVGITRDIEVKISLTDSRTLRFVKGVLVDVLT